jgi:hypothetical protein
MHGSPVLIPPKREQRSAHAGMRTSLRETQASRESESHAQEANVAEVVRHLFSFNQSAMVTINYGYRYLGEGEYRLSDSIRVIFYARR